MATGNVYTNKGQEFTIDQLDDNTATATPTYYLNWGSSGTTPAVGDTTLGTENAETRVQIVAGSQSQPATDTMRWTATQTATGIRTVQEVGIFSASTAGDLYIHIVHGSLALESGDTVDYTIDLVLKDTSE